jgi:Arc/MetJ-type ribon-helix-helix transcriptional regulator
LLKHGIVRPLTGSIAIAAPNEAADVEQRDDSTNETERSLQWKASPKGLAAKPCWTPQRQERRMTIEIPNDCAPIVEHLIATGSYSDEASIVADGIRLVAAKERLNADIEAGIRQLDAGERIPASEVYAKARQRVRAIEEAEN